MAISKKRTHAHYVSMPLPDLMEFILTDKQLIDVPSDARLEVTDDDNAGYQVVAFSWSTEEYYV
jgi:hypothetical protein